MGKFVVKNVLNSEKFSKNPEKNYVLIALVIS